MDFINYYPSKDNLYINNNLDDDEMDLEVVALEHGEIQLIMDMDTEISEQMEMVDDDVDELAADVETIRINERNTTYKKYGPDQIARFINMLQEQQPSIPKAAAACGIPRSSAYVLVTEFNRGSGSVLPDRSQTNFQRSPKKLFKKHTEFLIKLVDENPSVVLEEVRELLYQNFDYPKKISISSLHEHMKLKCKLSLKQAQKYTVERDLPRTLNLRCSIIEQWKEAGVNFQTNCVFVDEAGFHSQMMRARAWSKVGEPASVKVHTQKGINISIVGCISMSGTINFSKVEPLKKSDAEKIAKEFPQKEGTGKKRKVSEVEGSKPKPLKKGTTAYHIVRFMEAVMDVLDRHDKKGYFIVMDNCRIHHSAFVVKAINDRGYKPLFMPPYSPFLNPIEECWSKIKKHIRRNPLSEGDPLINRIAQACSTVTPEDCQGWIRHSETFWDRCINKELGLK
jgi:hypothetical protein